MAFPTSISAAQYSAISVSRVAVPTSLTEANLKANFSGSTTSGSRGDYVEIKNIRDMPAFGTPANIIKVPVYGQAQTQSIGAQSDAPDLELTINFVPSDWAKLSSAFANPSVSAAGTGSLGDAVGDGVAKVFQVALLTSKPASLNALAGGIGTVPNALIYFVGKIESLLITPSRDDSMTATVALSIQSDFFGPFTV
jgi:hypothetical protein